MSWLKHLIKKHMDKEASVEAVIKKDRPPVKRDDVVRVSEQNLKEIRKSISDVAYSTKTLGNEEKTEVIRMISMYKKNREIVNWLREDRGINVTEEAIDYYRKSHLYKAVIAKSRQEFESRIADVEFASKRRRLEELTDIFWMLKDNGKLKASSEVMDMMQAMMEPKKGEGDNYNVQFNQYNSMSDDELKHRMRENIIVLEQKETKRIENESIPENSESDHVSNGTVEV